MKNEKNTINNFHLLNVNSFRWAISLLVFLFLVPTLINAQAPYSSIQFQHIGSEQSIVQNTVNCMYQDRLGFIWAGTQQDLVRLGNESGHKKYNMSDSKIPGNLVKVILQDRSSNLWIGTDNGLCRYNYQLDSFDRSYNNKEQLGSKTINTLYQDKSGRIWVGTEDGLAYFKGDSLDGRLLLEQPVKKIVAGFDSTIIYIATKEKLYQLDTKKLPLNPRLIKDSLSKDSLNITAMYPDSKGNIWMGNRNGRIYRMPINQDEIEIDTILILPERIPINTICEDLAGNIWVGTRNGIVIFNPERPSEQNIVQQNLCNPRSLKNNDVLEIIRDAEDMMWIGTFAGGISRFDRRDNRIIKSFFKSTQEASLECYGNKFVWAILKDSKEDIWLGTRYDGLIKYESSKEKFTKISLLTPKRKLVSDIRTIIEDRQKNIWIGSNDGVFKKNNNDITERINEYNAIVIKEGVENDIWIGTLDKGLKRWDSRRGREIEYCDSNKPSLLFCSSKIYSLYVDNDSSIWVGTYTEGLKKLEKINGDYRPVKNPINTKNNIDSIKSDAKVLCMAKTEGNPKILWAGTSGDGLYAIDLQKKAYIDSLHFKVKENVTLGNKNFPSNTIYGIIPDQNRLWISTSNGLVLLDYTLPGDAAIIQIFTEADGLQNKEGNAGAYFKDSKNRKFYIGGVSGFNEINPDAVVQNNPIKPYKIYINELSVNGQVCIVDKKTNDSDFVLSQNPLLLESLNIDYTDLPLELGLVSLDYKNFQHSKFLVRKYKNGVLVDSTEVDHTFSFKKSDIYNWGAGEYFLNFSYWDIATEKWVDATEGQNLKLVISQGWNDWFYMLLKKYFLPILIIIILAVGSRYILYRQRRQARIKKEAETKAKFETEIQAKKEAEARAAREEKQKREMEAEIARQTAMFKELPNIINEVSRQDNIDTICQTTCQNLVDHFGFDYAAIALGDYLTNRIRIKKILIDPNQIEHLSYLKEQEDIWQDKANFSFNDHDILPAIFSDSLPIIYRKEKDLIFNVNGALINGQKVNLEAVDSPINKEIYHTSNHQDLNRFFLRLTHKQKEVSSDDENPDFPLGVIEAGYYKKPEQDLDTVEQARLRLFVDNCAQPYIRTYQNELKEALKPVLEACSKEPTYLDSYKLLIQSLVCILGADKGFLGFLSLNEERFYIGRNKPILENFNAGELIHLYQKIEKNHISKKGSIWDAIHSKESQLNHEAIDLCNYQYHSQLVLPLIKDEEAIGAIVLLSAKKHHFNKFQIPFLEGLIKEVVEMTYRQKLLSRTSELIFPFNIYSKKEETYQTLIERIQEFLTFSKIGIWERVKNDKGKPQLTFVQGSKALLAIPQVREDNFIDQTAIVNTSSTLLIPTDFFKSKNLNKTANFKSLFKSIICVPLKIDTQQEGQIIIFLEQVLPRLFSEDQIILDNIASKAAITILSQELFETYRYFSENEEVVSSSLESQLEDLIEVIKKEMNADQVVLLWKDKLKTSTDNYNIVITGSLKSPLNLLDTKTISSKEGDISNIILASHNNPILVHNKSEYLTKFGSKREWSSDKYKKEFFIREELNAMVALRLSDNSGILFLNYLSEQTFDDFFQRRLRAFGFLTTNSIRQFELNEENRQLKQSNININKEAQDSSLATEIAHNSGNLITSIMLSYADMESDTQKYDKVVDKKRVLQFLNELERPINQLNVDFDRLKDYRSTFEQPKEEIKLRMLIEKALDLLKYTLRKRHKIKLEFRQNGPNPDIWCNSRQIASVIINIIINALEAIPEKNKGLITITTENDSNYGIIKIRDDGPGIPPEIRMNIFKPNYSTKPLGTGIGLSSSKFIIEEEHLGLLELGHEDRKGATFIIKLPLVIKEN